MKTVERIHIGPSPCSEQLVDDELLGSWATRNHGGHGMAFSEM
jgi:hypothetical protein